MGPGKEKIQALEKKMIDLGIYQKDLEFKYVKSSGRGGQKVNKSVSAVFVKHAASGISVKYGKSRSQHLNKFCALRLLVEKIESLSKGASQVKQQKIDKIRKQKQRRKRRSAAKTKKLSS